MGFFKATDVTIERLNALINEIQAEILTSNNIVSRIGYPHFHDLV